MENNEYVAYILAKFEEKTKDTPDYKWYYSQLQDSIKAADEFRELANKVRTLGPKVESENEEDEEGYS